MLDTNIFVHIIETRAWPVICDLTASGHLDIVVTHVQDDVLAGIQDTEKHGRPTSWARAAMGKPVAFRPMLDAPRRLCAEFDRVRTGR